MANSTDTEVATEDEFRGWLQRALERDLQALRLDGDANEAARGALTVEARAARAQALALGLCAFELGRLAEHFCSDESMLDDV